MDGVARSALVGLSAGARTFMPVGVLVLRGRAPRALLLATAAELVGDKLPFAPSRLDPGALVGRAVSGAVCATALGGGRRGVLLGAGGALAGAWAGARARAALSGGGARSDLPGALAEDAAAVALAWLVTRGAD
jgi:uncharacterized membrane protein